jgi:hypothetical protein
MLRRPSKTDRRPALIAALLPALLGACSEHARNTLAGPDSLYTERRETISPLAGDALYANRTAQTIDPWSRASANNSFAFNGERMQSAAERYRTGRVIPPVSAMTSSSYSQQATQNTTGGASSSTTSIK